MTGTVPYTKAGGFENWPSLSGKNRVFVNLYTSHAVKSLKSSTNLIILKQNQSYRAVSSIFNLYFYIMFKCCLIRLCVFKNRVLWKIVVFLAQAQKWPDFKTARLRRDISSLEVRELLLLSQGRLKNVFAKQLPFNGKLPFQFVGMTLSWQSRVSCRCALSAQTKVVAENF